MSGLILPYKGILPKIHDSAFIAPNACIAGDVVIGEDSNIWFGVNMRGDVHEIDAAAIHRLRGRTRGIRGETRHQDGNAKGCGESFPHGPANQYPSGTWFHGSRHSR